ncbi:MAG TPA: nuclear transport factor 2 family protein [Terriglobia bacterium]|nr:nuclear transport factor 2 family protein [Terriglobia bacterium]
MTLSVLGVVALAAVLAVQAAGQATPALTEQDKTEIQGLAAAYARTLGSCAAEEYADLFAPEGGYFASGFRGQVSGRDRLIAMVQSERQCANGATPTPRAGNAPRVAIDVNESGVHGLVDLGSAGHYEDDYVKTPKGWRFAARTVIIPAEQAAGLNAREMLAIRRLAAGPQDAEDFWAAGQDGVKRFRSAGVVIGVSNGMVTGRVYLKDGGYYDDVYEKTPQGYWRFKSRAYVAAR